LLQARRDQRARQDQEARDEDADEDDGRDDHEPLDLLRDFHNTYSPCVSAREASSSRQHMEPLGPAIPFIDQPEVIEKFLVLTYFCSPYRLL
jgi:hypothetical protein